ncbi:MAG: hypothetical protein HC896_00510 [Bacteroidales bacterium]|nr:hypothetical protein [Bacteroidales bacterium]
MNVFYLGVDNPVEVFVSGVPSEKVDATITNGRIRRMPDGSWIVNPKTPGNALVEVLAEIDGKKQSVDWKEFRVKEVPNPVAKIAGKSSGVIQQNILLAQPGIIADMENFDFDLDFKVTEFVVSATVRGFTKEYIVTGNRFSKEQKT